MLKVKKNIPEYCGKNKMRFHKGFSFIVSSRIGPQILLLSRKLIDSHKKIAVFVENKAIFFSIFSSHEWLFEPVDTFGTDASRRLSQN
jgi:hypothetical protein